MGKPNTTEGHEGADMNFGERLRQLRQQHNISQRDLAVQVGIDFTTISHIEHGRMSPSAFIIYRLSHALDASPGELFYLSGKVPYELKTMLRDNPLLTELVYVLSERVLPDEVYRQMIELARQEVTV